MGGRLDLLTGKWIEDKPKRKAPEAAVGRVIDDFLRSIGAYVRTIKSDGTKINGKWRRSAQGAGISDRVGILPGGRFIAVEIKAPGRKRTLSEPQFNYLANIIRLGGVGVVADCVDDVVTALSSSQFELLSTLNQNGNFSSLDTTTTGKK